MKKLLLIALTVLALFGCETELKTTAEETQMCSISFALAFEEEIISFPSTKAIPDDPNGLVGEPEVIDEDDEGEEKEDDTTDDEGDKGDTPNDSLFSKIEYILYSVNENEEKTFVGHKKLTSDALTDKLSAGKYRFVFFCHNSSGEVGFTNNILSFDEVSDSFYGYKDVELNMDTKNITIDLNRVVSRIEVKSKDKLLKSYKKFVIKANNVINKFDVLNNAAHKDDTEFVSVVEHTFTQQEYGKINLTYDFYTFVPTGTNTITINTYLYGDESEKNCIKERTIDGVNPVENHIVRYTGSFFDPVSIESSFQLTVSSKEWIKETEIDIDQKDDAKG